MRHRLRLLIIILIVMFIFSFTACYTYTLPNGAEAEISTAAEIVTNIEATVSATEATEVAEATEAKEAAVQLDIVGMWKDKDGTTRIFSSDGTCQNVAKIDIGGPPPVYTISEKPDNNGYYILFVSQSGYNQTNFYVKVISGDEIEIYENPGAAEALYSLSRV
jgi:hypothetical protein